MTQGVSITADKVREVKAKRDKYAGITFADLGAMCGISDTAARNIANGKYDHLLAQGAAEPEWAPLLDLLGGEFAELRRATSELARVAAMNNELLRVVALGVTNANDPQFSKSKQTAASMRQLIIDATARKEATG